MHRPTAAPPCAMVIFGAAGDLTKRKLLPALLNLRRAGRLGDDFAVVAVARTDKPEDAFVQMLLDGMAEFVSPPPDASEREWLRARLRYVRGTFEDPLTFASLKAALDAVEREHATLGNVLFYFATPPAAFTLITEQIGRAGLGEERGGRWRRVVVEKPFGEDLESAQALNRHIAQVLSESQVYRIDHYLGKETVQNLMVLRFANGIFEPIWNRRYVDHVQITVAETVGVEERGGYYDQSGALRDMVQNHLFQVLALVAMEPPSSFRAEAVRDERVKVLETIRPLSPDDVDRHVVRGQYGEGGSNGQALPAYRDEPKVDPKSTTETFVALRLLLDNWRWAGVPFYLRTGKRLQKRVSEVAIQFRCAPVLMFHGTGVRAIEPNLLIVRIQPDEGISLRFGAKVPGPGVDIGTVKMDFKYSDYFGEKPSTGYETLLFDCMNGDPTLFHRADVVEAGWAAVMPILDVWRESPASTLPSYPSGSWGPDEAVELMARDNRHWRKP